jgi:hypothetical protein
MKYHHCASFALQYFEGLVFRGCLILILYTADLLRRIFCFQILFRPLSSWFNIGKYKKQVTVPSLILVQIEATIGFSYVAFIPVLISFSKLNYKIPELMTVISILTYYFWVFLKHNEKHKA